VLASEADEQGRTATVKATVLDYSTNATQPAYRGETPRYRYAALLVRVCLVAADSPVSMTWGPWTLTSDDGTTIEPTGSYSPDVLIAPLYPNNADKPTSVGQCRKGWIPFEVANG
jgi:hypothetical protein